MKCKEIFLLAFVAPIATLLFIDPNHFILGWNEGAGAGLLFAFIFLTMEWFDIRRNVRPEFTITKIFIIIVATVVFSSYFCAVYAFGQESLIAHLGSKLGYITKPQILSWTRVLDYLVYAAHVLVLATTIFGFKNLKYFPTPIVFLSGMALILMLDATFPYGSAESLQFMMKPILAITVFLLRSVGVRIDYLGGETLAVWGNKGFLLIEIYWQCAGVLSMVIYFLVIIILMLKLQTSTFKKLVYACFGAIGTFFVNIIRIFLIIYYGAYIDVNLRMFHESIGEVLFTIWIIIYLLIVTTLDVKFKRYSRNHIEASPQLLLKGR
ncbi:MAG: exosortase/archaeosortase family protein [Candidatus Bathyarchaeia archaeon]|nr:archaeosortase/exosortase family protein [Candidatus Bathyarchaeota archaeon]